MGWGWGDKVCGVCLEGCRECAYVQHTCEGQRTDSGYLSSGAFHLLSLTDLESQHVTQAHWVTQASRDLPICTSYVTFSAGPPCQASVGSRNLRGKCLLTAISPALKMGLPYSRIQKRCGSLRHIHSKQVPCARISKMKKKIQWKFNCLCFQT